MKKIFNIGPAIVGSISRAKKNLHRQIVVPFLPSYEVIFVMYGVVPGQPVTKNESVYNFEKGAFKEAESFFHKMVDSTNSYKVMPSEIFMKKRNKIVKTQHFGPVTEVRTWNQEAVAEKKPFAIIWLLCMSEPNDTYYPIDLDL